MTDKKSTAICLTDVGGIGGSDKKNRIMKNTPANFFELCDFLKMIAEMIESQEKKIIIDTGIYHHYNTELEHMSMCDCCDCDELNEDLDIIKIKRKNNLFLFSDIVKAFDKINKQLMKMEKVRCYKPDYFFGGFDLDYKSNIYSLIWHLEDEDCIYP